MTGPIRETLISGEPTVASQNWRMDFNLQGGEEVEFERGLLIQTQNGSFPHLRSPGHINLNLWEPETVAKSELTDISANKETKSRKEYPIQTVVRSYDDQSNPIQHPREIWPYHNSWIISNRNDQIQSKPPRFGSSVQNDQPPAAASKGGTEEHIPQTRSADTIRNRPGRRIHLESTINGIHIIGGERSGTWIPESRRH